MKDKFLKRVLCGVLTALTVFSLASCNRAYTVKPTVNKLEKSYYGLYDAVEDVSHEIGQADSDGWFADVNLHDAGAMLEKKEIELSAGVYSFSVVAMADNNSLDNNTVFTLSVIDSDTGEGIETFDVKRKMFASINTYEEMSISFALYEKRTVDVSVQWTDFSYIKISRMTLKSAPAWSLGDRTKRGEKMLSADKTENISYEEGTLYYFDFISYSEKLDDTVSRYDLANLIATLQGLVNREKPKLFINYTTPNGYAEATDKFWLQMLRREGEYLSSLKLVEVKYPITLLKMFENEFEGFVIWDERVPATVNVAATMGGVEGLLPLRGDESKGSLASCLTSYNFSEKKRIVSLDGKFKNGAKRIPDTSLKSTGSAKNDAYLWAKEKYLDTNLTNPTLMAYHLDAYSNSDTMVYYADLQNRYLANRDYYIAKKAFFFDLNPWENTLPDDDPTQKIGTDYRTAKKILAVQNKNAGEEIVTIGGFVPWDSKYTSWTEPTLPDVVPSEWQSILLFSEFNCVIDADAFAFTNMANASVYMNYPRKDAYVNLAKKYNEEHKIAEKATLENKNYIMFYMGDYDSSAWLNTQTIATYFTDSRRGDIPLMWPIAANNYARAPHVIDYLYRYQTKNDYFVYVNNGIGYFNPMMLQKEGRDSSLNGSWQSYFNTVAEAGEKFDLNVQGLIITAEAMPAELYKLYADVAPYGIITNWHTGITSVKDSKGDDVPTIHEVDTLVGNIEGDAWTIRGQLRSVSKGANFIVIRTTLRTATYITELYEYVAALYDMYQLEVVDPYTFFKLYTEANKE
ncbi:MAG: hypothetical protein IJY62_00115 [Clostridia bacterium]|nr:hypothetical protein [Clostridia bacterium]